MTTRKVAELNASILKVASNVALAIEGEVEDALEDAEKVIKQFVPARYVRKALAKIEAKLEDEGIEASFEKGITREALRKTAGEEVDNKDLDDLVQKIVDAVVDEIEDILADGDEVMDDEVKNVGDDADVVEVEAKMKSIVEHKLASVGIHGRFARVAKPTKLSLAERVAKSYKG